MQCVREVVFYFYFIIIIIKKVEIIVTLSIKNTAGALYKSQIKGENRYCKLRVMVTMLIVTRCFKFLRMDIFGMPVKTDVHFYCLQTML